MVVVMTYSSALGGSVSAAAVTAAVSSSDSPSGLWLNGFHGGHGFRPAAPRTMTKKKVQPLSKAVTSRSSCMPWTREPSLFGGMKIKDVRVRVQASSSDEAPGEKGQVKTEKVPDWATPGSDELPPWAKNEHPAASSQEPAQDVPFGVYLIGSTLVAIAAVGSVFEYFNKHAVFGVIPPDSPFYAPILGFFAITGLPTAGFLFYKSIQLANKASEEADKEDGFRR
ncbi:unnamed protein product [Calypogeia fissa]